MDQQDRSDEPFEIPSDPWWSDPWGWPFAPFGAIASLFFEPKSNTWRRWRRVAFTLGAISLGSIAATVIIAFMFGWSSWLLGSIIVSLVFLTAFSIVGLIYGNHHGIDD